VPKPREIIRRISEHFSSAVLFRPLRLFSVLGGNGHLTQVGTVIFRICSSS